MERDDGENEAEAGEGKGMLTVERRGARFLTCRQGGHVTSFNDPQDVRVAAGRYAARLKSPTILASKERMLRKRLRRKGAELETAALQAD